ncbi:hypothetical protein CLOM_g23500 [Closterium sp. NIES-68]|nr:hypothetical protein CLOM_g23500 [Closterium sp. NIES-68]
MVQSSSDSCRLPRLRLRQRLRPIAQLVPVALALSATSTAGGGRRTLHRRDFKVPGAECLVRRAWCGVPGAACLVQYVNWVVSTWCKATSWSSAPTRGATGSTTASTSRWEPARSTELPTWLHHAVPYSRTEWSSAPLAATGSSNGADLGVSPRGASSLRCSSVLSLTRGGRHRCTLRRAAVLFRRHHSTCSPFVTLLPAPPFPPPPTQNLPPSSVVHGDPDGYTAFSKEGQTQGKFEFRACRNARALPLLLHQQGERSAKCMGGEREGDSA